MAGLIIDNNTTPLSAVAEGVYFSKAAGAATVNLVATKTSGGASTATLSAITTIVAGTWVELAFCFDPYSVNVSGAPGAVLWYLNGMPQGSLPIPGSVPASSIFTTPILQIKNSTVYLGMEVLTGLGTIGLILAAIGVVGIVRRR